MYLEAKRFKFEEVSDNGTSGVVVNDYELPTGKFDTDIVSLLLLLPDGYPDASPDMFYVYPWIKLQGASSWPPAAAVNLEFLGTSWQRWSRHWNDWRPSRDGIQTWLLKVRNALETV